MEERKMATIRKISKIESILEADKIELVTVDGWKVVVGKDVGHKVGDFVVYCEIDSFLPIREEFEFLRKGSYKKMGDSEGFRLKTIKLRGQVSQGLIIPVSILEREDILVLESGVDVTEMLGIVKYDPPIPAELAGVAKGNFPSNIPKTDEERIQNLSLEYGEMKGMSYYVTEKLEGSSSTDFLYNSNFGVCSRNLELIESEGNTFWKVARELDLENKLTQIPFNISLQGELIGEGIQGNPYKLKGHTIRFFNGFNIDTQTRLGFNELVEVLNILDLPIVPILDTNFFLPETIEDLIKYADGKSALNPDFNREGVVIRSHDGKISFKVISNLYLLGSKD